MDPFSPVTLVVLTKDEESNLGDCLHSTADWVRDVFVVDSGSVDATLRIAAAHGARIVDHPFETHAKQWRWALATLPIATEWVLALDADQRVTPELRSSVLTALARRDEGIDGYWLSRRQVFRGRWIRHGGYYPIRLLKLFRRSAASVDDAELVDHHFQVSGRTLRLAGDLIEENRNEDQISIWVDKHNRYARLQAQYELAITAEPVNWRKRLWRRLPLYLRPALYFGYRYFFRLGFLDGKQGLIFHFLQAFWYRLMVDINLDEIRERGARER